MSQFNTSSPLYSNRQTISDRRQQDAAGASVSKAVGLNTVGCIDPRPMQRIDSFNTSISSHELQSSFSAESPFDFNHPTPSDGANEASFSVPELEEPFIGGESMQIYQDMDFINTSGSQSSKLTSFKTARASPHLVNMSTPDALENSRNLSQYSTVLASPISSLHQFEPSYARSGASLGPHASSRPYDQQPTQIMSPTIHVSTHTRGDSPARSETEQRRTARKRSVSHLSQGEYFPDTQDMLQSSGLMPPQDSTMNGWYNDEDDEERARSGVAPTERGHEDTTTFADVTQQHEDDKTIAEVEIWLHHTSLDPNSSRYARGHVRQDRQRSRSTGARPRPGQRPILKAVDVPGPGRVIEEDSEHWYSSDDESNRSLTSEEYPDTTLQDGVPDSEDSDVGPLEVPLLPNTYHRSAPWNDPQPVQPPDVGTRSQPLTASAAMYKFEMKSKDFDAMSRAATWGTTKVDSDHDSVFDKGKTRHPSLTTVRERSSSFLKSVIKRSNSRTRHTENDLTTRLEKVQSPEPIEDRGSTESQSRASNSNFTSMKTPSISAGIRGATGSLVAVGAGNAGLNIDTSSQLQPSSHPEGRIRKAIRRVRSKSDVTKSPKGSVGFQAMLRQEGGMPIPNITSPIPDELQLVSQSHTPMTGVTTSRPQSESPIRMPLSPQPANVMPNLEGFKIQIGELNPGLPLFLIERAAHDQVRRYKRLVNSKVDHVGLCTEHRCPSADLCGTSKNEAKIIPPVRDVGGHFRVTPNPDSDNEELFDGLVTRAAFPDGIPLPPVAKLPAKFECFLCFQVKTFHKPSDWTKHVHEDVQPFTCTFPNCQEPKPFKRKADWVRHENERHRHLEWWRCTLNGCQHVCYRKDNFVQHLVREHKKTEPKIKGKIKVNVKSKAKGSTSLFNQEEQEFWQLVDSCRHESTKDPRTEPCPFCQNICTSWKKLSVHVAKHMEQIAMPVIELAQKRNVTKDTIISPVEPLPAANLRYSNNDHGLIDMSSSLSPFSHSGLSYNTSSAEQSPHMMQRTPNMQYMHPAGDLGSFTPRSVRNSNTNSPYSFTGGVEASGFATLSGYNSPQFVYQSQNALYPQPAQYVVPEHVSHNMATERGFQNIQNNSTHQTPYVTGPDEQYMPYDANLMMYPDHELAMQIQAQQQAHIQTPITSYPMSGVEFAYQQQQW